MNTATETTLREQLIDRRRRIEAAIPAAGEASDLLRLLREVDSALTRFEAHTYGECEFCDGKVEESFLLANPLIQYCLCDLTPAQQKTLQDDLDLASRIQWALLPKQNLRLDGWEAHYRYQPHGPVSGDYCDIIESSNGRSEFHFMLGDVSGKGVAASLLMAHLNALLRSLVHTGLPLDEIVGRANQLFSDNAFSATNYVTLVAGEVRPGGEVEICNAGHCPPILLRRNEVVTLNATGFPVGIVRSGPYQVSRVALEKGDTLFLYTDGLTEATDRSDQEYGAERLIDFLRKRRSLEPDSLAAACLEDVQTYRSGAPRTDDLTILVLRRSA